MDCFAHRTALCAEPVARNDDLKIPHVIGAMIRTSKSLNSLQA